MTKPDTSLIEDMAEALMAARKVLRHAAKVTTVQMRNNKRVQIPTVRAVQAQHELNKLESVIKRYEESKL